MHRAFLYKEKPSEIRRLSLSLFFCLQAGFDFVHHIQLFPRHIQLLAAHVAIGSHLTVNGATQIQPLNDCGGTQVKHLVDNITDYIITDTGLATPMA